MPASEFKVIKFNLRIYNTNVELRRDGGPADSEPLGYLDNSLGRRTLYMLAEMRRKRRLEGEEVKILGEWLYSLLLQNRFGEKLNEAISDSSTFVRVELEFEDTGSPLAALPWEYLRRPSGQKALGYFLAKENQIALIRLPQVECRTLAETAKKKPRILFVTSSPVDLPKLVFGEFIKQFRSKQGQMKAVLEPFVLETPYVNGPEAIASKNKKPQATFDNFRQALDKFQPHVVHFLGHGKYEGEQGKVAFVQDENHRADWKAGEDVAKALKGCPSVKLAFLQACETAREDSRDSQADWSDKHQALSSVAGCVVQISQIPAIVAMQSDVENLSANTFASAFYRSLVEHKPIYQAIQIARAETGDTTDHFSCVPVLYLDSSKKNDDGILFPDTEVSQASEQANKRPTSISCPWCPKVIEVSPQAIKEPVICPKCGNQLRCPNCNERILGVDPDQDQYYCQSNCGEVIERRKSKTPPPLPPSQRDVFGALTENSPKTRQPLPRNQRDVFGNIAKQGSGTGGGGTNVQ